jgi:hypothetical protein
MQPLIEALYEAGKALEAEWDALPSLTDDDKTHILDAIHALLDSLEGED